jgi:hypothetical protein
VLRFWKNHNHHYEQINVSIKKGLPQRICSLLVFFLLLLFGCLFAMGRHNFVPLWLFYLFTMWRQIKKDLLDASTLILDFSVFRNVEIIFLFFINYTISGILLQDCRQDRHSCFLLCCGKGVFQETKLFPFPNESLIKLNSAQAEKQL